MIVNLSNSVSLMKWLSIFVTDCLHFWLNRQKDEKSYAYLRQVWHAFYISILLNPTYGLEGGDLPGYVALPHQPTILKEIKAVTVSLLQNKRQSIVWSPSRLCLPLSFRRFYGDLPEVSLSPAARGDRHSC